jgi:hypothetical protein
MAAQVYYSPFIPAFSSNGAPVPGALLNFYLSGTSTRTPVYTTSGMTVELSNPVEADAAGKYPNIYLDEDITYRVVQTDADGAQLGDIIDPYVPGQALKGETGEPGANVLAAGLFTELSTMSIPVDTDLIQTSGHTVAGVGAAIYSVGAIADPDASETAWSTNSANSRPIYLAETEPTVYMFGAKGDNTNNDRTAIQAGNDYLESIGGGVLRVPEGIFKTSGGIQLSSNVTLQGNGFGSIIRPQAGGMGSVTTSGVTVTAAIVLVGVSAAGVRDLTLDMATNAVTNGNGIQIGESNADDRSTDCRVDNVKVMSRDRHNYMVYVKCSDRNWVRGCTLIGHSSIPSSDLAGVEIYGGTGNKVIGNDVSYCNPGITLTQETATADSDLSDSVVALNRIDNCRNGIVVIHAASRSHTSSLIAKNIVNGSTNRCINVGVASTDARRILVLNNTCYAASGGGAFAMEGPNNSPVLGLSSSIIRGNLFSEGVGCTLQDCDPAFDNNTVEGTTGVLLQMIRSGSRVTRNTFANLPVGEIGIDMSDCTNAFVNDNDLYAITSNAVRLNSGCSGVEICDNRVRRAAGAQANAAIINGPAAAGTIARGNKVLLNPPTVKYYDIPDGCWADGQSINWAPASNSVNNLALPAGDLIVALTGSFPTAAWSITGIANGLEGKTTTFFNYTNYDLTLESEHASSTAANRIAGLDTVVPPNGSATLVYARHLSRWVVTALVA